jgi:hypothetical protein
VAPKQQVGMLGQCATRLATLTLDHFLCHGSALCINLGSRNLFEATVHHRARRLMRLVVKAMQVKLLKLCAQANRIKADKQLADSRAFIVSSRRIQSNTLGSIGIARSMALLLEDGS